MLTIEVHATSHIGRVRRGNEDNYLLLSVGGQRAWTSAQESGEFVIESQTFQVADNGVVLAVSDGMGGALAGEVASKMAVETVSERVLDDDPDKTISPDNSNESLISKLYDATVYANYLIHQQGRADAQFQGMGATFTGIGVSDGVIDIIQVGDSRAYLLRSGRIYQITKDQSLVQQLIDAGQITPEEAESHTLKNVILQALGAQPEIYPVSARLQPTSGDIFLLCSDGLSNKVNAERMQRIVTAASDRLEMACAELVREANECGGEDNITVVIARITGDLPNTPDDGVRLEFLDMGGMNDTSEQETGELI